MARFGSPAAPMRTALSDGGAPLHNFRSADRRRLGLRSTAGRERLTRRARRISGGARAPATYGIGIHTRCWRIVRGRLSRIRSRLWRCSAVLGLPRLAAPQEGSPLTALTLLKRRCPQLWQIFSLTVNWTATIRRCAGSIAEGWYSLPTSFCST